MNPDTPSPTLSSDMLQTAPLHDDERWKQQIKNKVMFEDLLPEEKRVCVSRQFLAQCSSDSQTSSSKALCWFTFPQSHRSHSCLFVCVCVFGCVCVWLCVCLVVCAFILAIWNKDRVEKGRVGLRSFASASLQAHNRYLAG